MQGKNEDINKIIETVAIEETEQIEELQQKNELLTHENSLLMRHLEGLREEHKRHLEGIEQRREESGQWERKYEEIKRQVQ